MYVVLVLILLFLLVRESDLERFVGMKFFGSFLSQKKSGSQEDNQVSILGCPHLFFGRLGREDT